MCCNNQQPESNRIPTIINDLIMKKILLLGSFVLVLHLLMSCAENNNRKERESRFNYLQYGRLTDPQENEYLLQELPDNLEEMCDIANVQSVHHTMMSQWKIPRSEWKVARANHDIKDILDTLKVKGDGSLSTNRKLEDRIFGACTKESIFSTSMLRAKGIPARIRVGYFTNLYSGDKALEFWRNVNNFSNTTPMDSVQFDEYTLYMKRVNKSIEHWVTEYWDKDKEVWRVLDIRPEYVRAYGIDVDYHMPDQYYEFAYEAWQKINDPDFENDAYSEGDLDGRSHIRYQMLLDFYSLLNHDIPGVFDDDGNYIGKNEDNEEITFLRKKYEELTEKEILELDALSALLASDPDIDKLLDFYYNAPTLKMNSIENDTYSYVFADMQEN